jgi:16S rRNA A1518/A1519 N6-dimethyltransferase RsmA/KsgA/DIM1 with predicted DNA glycosylase/AP lyase activity
MRISKRRSLGQHMLVDRDVLLRIINASRITKDEIVCEAGTGNGILTNELCKYGKSVISFEIDSQIFEKAKTKLFSFPNLRLVNADIFRSISLNFDVFISNLPYSKSKEALQWLALQKFQRAIIMVQKDFADKLQAIPGKENYRAITVITQHCFNLQKLFVVHEKSFDPEPSVESEVIRLSRKNTAITKRTIGNLEFIFSQRNKKASTAARKFGVKFDFDNLRIAELETHDLIKLAESL